MKVVKTKHIPSQKALSLLKFDDVPNFPFESNLSMNLSPALHCILLSSSIYLDNSLIIWGVTDPSTRSPNWRCHSTPLPRPPGGAWLPREFWDFKEPSDAEGKIQQKLLV